MTSQKLIRGGKGGDALKCFRWRLKTQKPHIECVCMDMSNAYGKWVRENLPGGPVIYDHFHVIKAMNDRINFNTYMPDFLEKIFSQKNPTKVFYLAARGTDRERQSILRPDSRSGIDVLEAWEMDDDWYLNIVWKQVERSLVTQAKKGLESKVIAFTLDEI